ncbi:cysteine desulfurase [Plasmodium sp. DRC-Itaito]|nr:cysteine desulfurase [Plasmodium sp. DRC-Itaito]
MLRGHRCLYMYLFFIFLPFSFCYIRNNDNRSMYIVKSIRKSPNIKLRLTKDEKPYIDNHIIDYFKNVREHFPFFKENNSLIYFDSAATTHKPSCVIEKMSEFYKKENSNIHRGIYKLSQNATKNYENVRETIREYINCEKNDNIIFTNGSTYGLNIVCKMIMDEIIKREEDEIYLSYLEHHSNIVPWQEYINKEKKGRIKYISLNKSGYINIKKLISNINENTKVISICHASNVIGNIQNIEKIIKKIKKVNPNIIIIIDASQSFAHIKYDIKKMKKNKSCPDILITSGHKFCASLGTGFIFINKEISSKYKFKPLLYGSNIITDVCKYKSKFVTSLSELLESGTQNIAGILSMGISLEFLKKINWHYVYQYEMYLYDLLIYYMKEYFKNHFIQLPNLNISYNKENLNNKLNMQKQDQINIYNNNEPNYINDHNITQSKQTEYLHSEEDMFKIYTHDTRKYRLKKIGILPLWSNKFSSFDLITFLDFKNICIRAGHHCASLLHKYYLKVPDTSRISIYFYNTPEEIKYLAQQIASTSFMLNKIKNK